MHTYVHGSLPATILLKSLVIIGREYVCVCACRKNERGGEGGREEEEEEEGLLKADAVNEKDPERDHATQV